MKEKKSGFTLIEMIIVLALTTLILGIISSIFITGNKVFSDSDVKSTLQMEAQAIQEKISTIGMQASGIENITSPNLGEVIKSYNKEDEEKYFKINLEDKKLSITEYSEIGLLPENTQLLSGNVESFEVKYSDSFAEFNIELSQKKSFSNVTYPINFIVTFRNKSN